MRLNRLNRFQQFFFNKKMLKRIIVVLLALVLVAIAEIPLAGAGIKPEDTLLQVRQFFNSVFILTVLQYILIKNGIVTIADGAKVADVLIHGDKIEKIGKNLKAPIGARVIDASGKYVMPGGIDPHTHMEVCTISVTKFFLPNFLTF